ncbi:MAG: hypothetical protein AB7O47_11720 [Flavobacteriales bacterium]
MQKAILIIVFVLNCLVSYCQAKDSVEVKPRNMEYSEFIANYSVNDTSSTVINIFFDKKSNSAIGQMSMFPITAALYPVLPIFSIGLSAVSFPFFVNGSLMLVKYRKKKLQKVLIEYKETRTLPKWIRKKVNKSLDYGRFDDE